MSRPGSPSVSPAAEVITVPVADGGDGTLDAAVAAGFRLVPVTVEGPTGEPVHTGYARKDGTAVVELADACGLVRLPGGVLAPLTASSTGFGQVVAAALDAGCRRLVLAIGGSASTDGGAGMLTALGARILDTDGATGRRPAAAGWSTSTGSTCPVCTPAWPAPRWCWPATWTTRCSATMVPPPCTGRRRARTRTTWPGWTVRYGPGPARLPAPSAHPQRRPDTRRRIPPAPARPVESDSPRSPCCTPPPDPAST